MAGACAWLALLTFQTSAWRTGADYRRGLTLVLRIVMGQASTLPLILGGAALLLGVSAGLYGLAAGLLLATIWTVVDSWVLLVEILR